MSKKSSAKQEPELTGEQIARLWQHRLHEDNMFNTRMNFFVVFESILIAVVGILFTNLISLRQILISIIVLGIIITIIWTYIQGKQRFLLDLLKDKCEKYLPEYYAYSEELKKYKRWRFRITTQLAYTIPILITIIWVILLFSLL